MRNNIVLRMLDSETGCTYGVLAILQVRSQYQSSASTNVVALDYVSKRTICATNIPSILTGARRISENQCVTQLFKHTYRSTENLDFIRTNIGYRIIAIRVSEEHDRF